MRTWPRFSHRPLQRQVLQVVLLLILTFTMATQAAAGIIGVTDSRVQGEFITTAPYAVTDPLGQATPLAAPIGDAAIGGVNGVDWVPFTYPNPRYYSGNDGAGTTTGTAIVGGYVIDATNDNTTFIRVPQNSYLLHGPGVNNDAHVQLNFSIDYAVDAGGLNATLLPAFYNVFGNVANGGAVAFSAEANYWHLGAPSTHLGTLQLNYANNTPGPFNANLFDLQLIDGFAGAGTLRVNGFIRWEIEAGDGVEGNELVVNTIPLPAALPMGLAILASLGARRRALASPVA